MMNINFPHFPIHLSEQNKKFKPIKREPKAPTNANYTWTTKDYKNN